MHTARAHAEKLRGVLIKMMLAMRIQEITRAGTVAVVPQPTAL